MKEVKGMKNLFDVALGLELVFVGVVVFGCIACVLENTKIGKKLTDKILKCLMGN